MKLMKNIAIILLIIITNHVKAQNLDELKDYTWDSIPNYQQYQDENEDLIAVRDKIVADFEYDENDKLVEYFLEHEAYILNSDEKIEDFNKIYIPMNSSSSQLVEMKARVIQKNGDIIVLDKSKVLTSKDEQTNREYKYYAFEGIEKGSTIEYYYLLKKSPSYSGTKLTVQTGNTKYNFSFELYSPNNLVFKFKSYNKLPEVELDTNASEYYHWQLSMDKIDKLEEESESAYNADKMYFVYKLDKNTYSRNYDISSYSTIANNLYTFYYTEKTKSQKKELQKLIKASNCKIARDKASLIRALEDYIKLTFYVVDFENDELRDVSKVITNKIASHQGIVNLYISLLNELEIEHQVVLTCDRFNTKFDKDFESGNFLTDYLIYFPEIKSFLSPTDIGSRLGYPPYELTNNYGMFVKEVNINNIKAAVAKINFIPPVDYKKSYDEMKVDITIDENDIYKSMVNFERSTGGYYAINIQPYMNLFKEENKKELIDEFVKFIDEDVVILEKKVFNDDAKYFGIEPFKVVSKFELSPFIENAGDNIILKVGNLIGPQVEMYQEKKRVLPIENQFKRNYHRVINITIPEKYKIKNPDDLNIHNEYVKDDKPLLYFKSSYTLKDNVLSITVDEYYDMIEIEPELYDTYRKIINSAADFNKISLILE